jgi:hypothetical protein
MVVGQAIDSSRSELMAQISLYFFKKNDAIVARLREENKGVFEREFPNI